MKRKSFRYRGMSFPPRFVRSIDYYYPTLFRVPPAKEQFRARARRIFVIKRAAVLPATNTQGKTIQRILIFDDHPDSLRLVLGDSADAYAPNENTRWWEPVLGWALVICLMILMFLPLWLKLRL